MKIETKPREYVLTLTEGEAYTLEYLMGQLTVHELNDLVGDPEDTYKVVDALYKALRTSRQE